MIKINRNFNKLSKKHRISIKAKYNLVIKLNNKAGNNSPFERFYSFLSANIDGILEKDINYIKSFIIPRVDAILGNNYFSQRDPNDRRVKLNKNRIKEVGEIFNYTKFSKFSPKIYNAYDLLEELNINVCPYCNRQYINTMKPTVSKGGTRPTIDHYLLKSDYPYLALSFWNLIPSCYSCNSQLRTTRNIGLHPYLKGFENILHFYTEIIDITEYCYDTNKDFNLTLKKYTKIKPNANDYNNAKLNEEVFRLNDIFQNQKDYVREIIYKRIIYGEHYSKDLYNDFDDFFENENEVKNMMLSNYTDINDLEKRPLSKLTKDIAEELGLI